MPGLSPWGAELSAARPLGSGTHIDSIPVFKMTAQTTPVLSACSVWAQTWVVVLYKGNEWMKEHKRVGKSFTLFFPSRLQQAENKSNKER